MTAPAVNGKGAVYFGATWQAPPEPQPEPEPGPGGGDGGGDPLPEPGDGGGDPEPEPEGPPTDHRTQLIAVEEVNKNGHSTPGA